eukprot:gene9053-1150_t
MASRVYETDGVLIGDPSVETTLLLFKKTNIKKNMIQSMKSCETQRIFHNSGNIIQFSVRESRNDKQRMSDCKFANIVLLVFDVTSKTSFDNISSKWVPFVRNINSTVPFVLVANCIEKRSKGENCLSSKDGQKLAHNIGANYYFEVSLKDQNSLETLFETCSILSIEKSKNFDILHKPLNNNFYHYKNIQIEDSNDYYGHTACKVLKSENKTLFYIFGPKENEKNSLYVFDPELVEFEKEISLPNYFENERRFHTSIVKDKEIFIYGGKGKNHISNDFISYNFETDKWKFLPRGETSLYGHTSNIIGSKIIIFGGLTCYKNLYYTINHTLEYDIQNKIWSKNDTQINVPTARYFHSSETFNFQIFIFGGLTISKNEKSNLYSTKTLNDLWVYSSGFWTNISTTQNKLNFLPRWGHFSFIKDYELYFMGSSEEKKQNIAQITKFLSTKETKTSFNYGIFNFDNPDDDNIPIFSKPLIHDSIFYTIGGKEKYIDEYKKIDLTNIFVVGDESVGKTSFIEIILNTFGCSTNKLSYIKFQNYIVEGMDRILNYLSSIELEQSIIDEIKLFEASSEVTLSKIEKFFENSNVRNLINENKCCIKLPMGIYSFLENLKEYRENDFEFSFNDSLKYKQITKKKDHNIHLINNLLNIEQLNLDELKETLNQNSNSAIIWISNLLNYCQYSSTNENTKLEEDISKFHNFVNSFMNDENSIPIYLCLNMKDTFNQTLKNHPIEKYFKTINPNSDSNTITKYISELYVKKLIRNQKIIIHETCFISNLNETEELFHCIMSNLKNPKSKCECKSNLMQFQFVPKVEYKMVEHYF